ncbi:hypothetical protein P6709_12105 [Jeotgalibacillus sp. ET6]|uniref:hypothetical protein n=1 Tax=Jeotgalibacillus sp. ET6 TaxID=3037260 RepID=UPI0024186FD4|nr:hypothetical protein [Jeotgalibacillus sp. ET6]MDG5472489.1 hypothetical protein [Jeotgalibacillus sp. ET6]
MAKSYSWRSYTFLTVSVLVSILMVSIDPVAVAFSERAATFMINCVFIGLLLSIVLAVINFISNKEKRLISIIALIITLLNIAVVVFFLWFGANFS